MTKALSIGYIPLTDAAPIIVAHELGFAEEEGLSLKLSRENSWSVIRDKLGFGMLDAAHMLAPMAIGMSLGLGTSREYIHTPMVLSQNGNSFVAGRAFEEELLGLGGVPHNAMAIGKALVALGQKRPIKIAVPFMASMHTILTRFLIEKSGGQPGKILDFVVAPPSMIDRVLDAGEVDGFMVGAPWASLAVERRVGNILLNGSQIWQAAPEKVLAARAGWLDADPDRVLRLIRAVYRAGLWSAQPSSHAVLSEILSRPDYLGLPSDIISQALGGQMVTSDQGLVTLDPLAIRFGGISVGFPWKSGALWIAEQLQPYWGVAPQVAAETAKATFRTDLFRHAFQDMGPLLPTASQKVEGRFTHASAAPSSPGLTLGPDAFFDGSTYDPA